MKRCSQRPEDVQIEEMVNGGAEKDIKSLYSNSKLTRLNYQMKKKKVYFHASSSTTERLNKENLVQRKVLVVLWKRCCLSDIRKFRKARN